MMKNKILLLAGYLLLSCSISFSQIKVACIGNSITYGAGIKDRETNSYPAQLGKLLGNEWEVKNFGVSGATLLKLGDKPYWKQSAFDDAKNFNPDVVIIKLGTNDTKPQNWKYKDNFTGDYTSLIAEFKSLPSKPYVFICSPVPAYKIQWGINDSVITTDIIPMVKKISSQNNISYINLYKPLSNHKAWFPDNIHPNAEGAGVMANVISKQLIRHKRKILKRKM